MIAFVFDLDGTLLDLPVDIDAVRMAAAAPLRARGFTGELRPILQTIERAAAALATDEQDHRALVSAARGAIDAGELSAADAAAARSGAARCLAAVRAADLPVGLVTNNGRACVAPALARAGLAEHLVDAPIITRDDVERPKPDPEGLVRMARLLLPNGGTLVFVGDGSADIEAAARARAELGGIAVHSVYVGVESPPRASRVVATLDEFATTILAPTLEAGRW